MALSDVSERTLLIWSSHLKTLLFVWANQSEKTIKEGDVLQGEEGLFFFSLKISLINGVLSLGEALCSPCLEKNAFFNCEPYKVVLVESTNTTKPKMFT